MRKTVFYIAISITGAFLWIILNENAGIRHLITGAAISGLAMYLSEKLLLDKNYLQRFGLPFSFFFIYPPYLLYKIYTSGIKTLWMIIKGSCNPKMSYIQTSLENDFLRSLLANSITLTPGTISVDKTSDKLLVLYFDDKDKCMLDPGSCITGKYEDIIGRRRKKG